MKVTFQPIGDIPKLADQIALMPDRIKTRLQELLAATGGQVVAEANQILEPIYEGRDEHDWDVTGELTKGVVQKPLDGGMGVFITVDGPAKEYARRRHFENRTHPSTVGYLLRPLLTNLKELEKRLSNVLGREISLQGSNFTASPNYKGGLNLTTD